MKKLNEEEIRFLCDLYRFGVTGKYAARVPGFADHSVQGARRLKQWGLVRLEKFRRYSFNAQEWHVWLSPLGKKVARELDRVRRILRLLDSIKRVSAE